MRLLFTFCFAAGVLLLWQGLVRDVQPSLPLDRLRRRVAAAGLPLPLLLLLVAAAGLLAGVVVWWLAGVPALAIAAAVSGCYAPIAWLSRRRERLRRARERAWPAALAQLGDALEAGIAFPAAVALVAGAGPAPLQAEFTRFDRRLRAGGLEQALDGLREAGERTTDTVALLLRAGLLELPAGRLAPLLRELSVMLAERFESAEKARSRAASLQVEAAVLALSPVVLLLLVGAASPGYLAAYRTPAGTVISVVAGVLIFGCYLLMRRLGRVPQPRRSGGRR
jgi:tight adherence protein B